jgi:hypothetical protein
MLEYVFILLIAYLVEVIHVELAHKGGKIAVSEVGREYLLLEAFDV